MALNAKKAAGSNGGSKFKPQAVIEPGSYPARVAQIIDLGMQEQQPWQGQEKPPAHEMMVTYELVDEFMLDEDGNEMEDKPRWLSETFPLRNLQSDLAKSTKRYKALDPTEEHDGDFTQLVGAPCNVMVVTYTVKSGPNAGTERNKVDNVNGMRPRDAAKTPELKNEPKVFLLDEPDLEIFKSLPEWLQDKIKGNLEFAGSPLEAALAGGGTKPKGEEKKAPEKAPEKPEAPEEPDMDDDEDDKPW